MNYNNYYAVFTNKVKDYDWHTCRRALFDCHDTLALHKDKATDDRQQKPEHRRPQRLEAEAQQDVEALYRDDHDLRRARQDDLLDPEAHAGEFPGDQEYRHDEPWHRGLEGTALAVGHQAYS